MDIGGWSEEQAGLQDPLGVVCKICIELDSQSRDGNIRVMPANFITI